ncbi:MAG: hypothetical protein OHK0029_32210 [Armatimonadaceae bacterium]
MEKQQVPFCPGCGRALYGNEACPNCTRNNYAYSSPVYGTYPSVTSTPAPRVFLLIGAMALLLLVVLIVALRRPSSVLNSASVSPPVPFSQQYSQPVAVSPRPRPDTRPEDAAFWERKAERDLRDAETYVPTTQEEAYRESVRWQIHQQTSDAARASDYVLRRPEMVRR